MGGRFGKYADAKRKAQISTLATGSGKACYRKRSDFQSEGLEENAKG